MIQIATIETNKAERLMKALCNHFARKITAKYEGDKGYIEFGDGKCEITGTSNTLILQVEAENSDNLSRIKQVVVDHLLRFAPGEDIQISWKDASKIQPKPARNEMDTALKKSTSSRPSITRQRLMQSQIKARWILRKVKHVFSDEKDKAINRAVDDFQQLAFNNPNTGITLKYNLYIPKDYDANKSCPLVLFIHDAGVVSTDPRITLIQGLGAVIWATPSEQVKHESFVLAPQYSIGIVNDKSEATRDLDVTVDLVQALVSQYNIDRNRLYTTGQSMGCMASIEMLIKYPNLFAAALLVAGQWDATKMSVLTKANMWVIVSEGDRRAFPGMNASIATLEAAGAKISRATWDGRASKAEQTANVSKMIAEGNNIKYTVLAKGTVVPKGLTEDGGNNHVHTWRIAYTIEGLRDWLFAQVRTTN